MRREAGRVEIGLCERHRPLARDERRAHFPCGLGLSILVFTQVQATDIVLPPARDRRCHRGVVGLIYAAVGTRVVRATKITDTHVWPQGRRRAVPRVTAGCAGRGAGGALPTPDAAASLPIPRPPRRWRSARRGTGRSPSSSAALSRRELRPPAGPVTSSPGAPSSSG